MLVCPFAVSFITNFFVSSAFFFSSREVRLFEISVLLSSLKSFISFLCMEPWKMGVSHKWLSNLFPNIKIQCFLKKFHINSVKIKKHGKN